MKNAVIVHGKPGKDEYYDAKYPSSSNFGWIPWLQKQLVMHDIDAQTPEIFKAYVPEYAIWKKEFERFDITPETILVGHSCGGGFLVRWLSNNPDVKVGVVVLVAPWIDPNKESTKDFFEFTINPKLASQARHFIIFGSDNDKENVQQSIQIIRDACPDIEYKEFHNYGHFCFGDIPELNMPTLEFPELVEECLK